MIKFKGHDGMVFCMLEEPVPLTPDAEMPCFVRFITHGVIGEYVKEHWLDCNQKNVPIYIDDVDSDGDVTVWIDENRNEHHCCPFPMFEIIGTLVKEGSKEWALYRLMQGEKICHKKFPSIMYCESDYGIMRKEMRYNYVECYMSVPAWLNRAYDNGWQIYEPEQLKTMPVNEFTDLLDAPIGWICKTRDGGSFPLKYIEVSPTRYAYEDKSGLTVYVMANGRYKKNGTDGRDIISCEHEQPKPELQYKVGDWVEWCGDQYMVESAPPQSGGRYDIRSPYDELGCSVYPENITRKLSPYEVVIRIGCLSGTVDVSIILRDAFFLKHSDGSHSLISLSALDTPTCELVESLLRAMRGES